MKILQAGGAAGQPCDSTRAYGRNQRMDEWTHMLDDWIEQQEDQKRC